MEYLVNKKDLGKVAHMWIGVDTVCRTVAHANLEEEYMRASSPMGRRICGNCMSRAKNPKKWQLEGKVERPAKNRKKAKAKKQRFKDSFYNSDEWRKLRYQVLKENGGNCMACGRSYKSDGVKIHVDHIKPRSTCPHLELEKDNLQVLCDDCNLGKSNLDSTDWR